MQLCKINKKALYIVRLMWRRDRDSNPRRLLTSTVFKTAAFDRSAISPYFYLHYPLYIFFFILQVFFYFFYKFIFFILFLFKNYYFIYHLYDFNLLTFLKRKPSILFFIFYIFKIHFFLINNLLKH